MPILFDKLLPLFVYPVGLTISCGLAAFVLSMIGYTRTSRAVLAAGVAILWISSTPLFANWLYSRLEAAHPPVAIESLPSTDVAVVLGGAVGGTAPPRLAAEAREAFDRVLHAARIFRAGKAEAILVSGGNLPWLSASLPEAELIGELLVEFGVPRTAISLETMSRNTRENAVGSAEIMTSNNWDSALLVTSAAHMPRALAAFEKVGIKATPASTDIRVTYPLSASILDFLPSTEALALTTDAMKELLGKLVYRMRGWV